MFPLRQLFLVCLASQSIESSIFFLSASNQALQQWIQIRFCISGFLQQHICPDAYTQFNFCDVAIFCNSRCTIFPHLECIFPCGSILLLEPRNKFANGDNIKRLFFIYVSRNLSLCFPFFCLFDVAEEGGRRDLMGPAKLLVSKKNTGKGDVGGIAEIGM